MGLTELVSDEVKQSTFTFLQNNISHIAVGDGTTAFSPAQTALANETFRKAVQEVASFDDSIFFSMFITGSENNGNTIAEIAGFDAVSGGQMFSRKVLTNSIDKNASTEVWLDTEIGVEVTTV